MFSKHFGCQDSVFYSLEINIPVLVRALSITTSSIFHTQTIVCLWGFFSLSTFYVAISCLSHCPHGSEAEQIFWITVYLKQCINIGIKICLKMIINRLFMRFKWRIKLFCACCYRNTISDQMVWCRLPQSYCYHTKVEFFLNMSWGVLLFIYHNYFPRLAIFVFNNEWPVLPL